ncbi:DsbA family protein [Shewanella nanhaiensis]|uniref:DsbA family protein n=1 Tax=Shewanella nanhaiensis TaxID=2864872 RepID=A0ABS7DXQ0_9GAMM|nr:DsbA family protein [Shewanella nanhaiensis]MBW8182196.1 DsbA family protein [Shewanella nanhaiensis]
MLFSDRTETVVKSKQGALKKATDMAVTLLMGVTLLSWGTLAHGEVTSLTGQQQADVKAIIKDALINDPELLKEAIIALQVREQQGANAVRESTLNSHKKALFETKTDPWKGASDPEITMVYFTDFNCPYCKKLEPSLDRLVKEFPQLKIIIKMVPLQGEASEEAVALAQTVWLNEPSKYLKLKEVLMSSPRKLDSESIAKVAKLTGTEKWLNNTDEAVNQQVKDNVNLMMTLGLRGTPAMIFGDKVIPGLVTYEVLKEQLEEAIEAQE